jgi:hypothetical protein
VPEEKPAERQPLACLERAHWRDIRWTSRQQQFRISRNNNWQVSAPLQGNAGSFTPTVGGFSSGISLKGNGVNLFTILDFSSTFDFTQNQLVADGSLNFTNGPATRNLDFNITSETLVLSPVPLPPALPLFAAALLALGIFGYVRRAKDVTPAHGQAY